RDKPGFRHAHYNGFAQGAECLSCTAQASAQHIYVITCLPRRRPISIIAPNLLQPKNERPGIRCRPRADGRRALNTCPRPGSWRMHDSHPELPRGTEYMTYIAFSILCSVLVSVLFKLAPGRRIDVRQVIAGSYLVAVLLCLGLFRSSLAFLWQPFGNVAWGLLLILGVLMPSLFLVLARSVIAVGVARTDAAQRLSLLLPLLAAFTLFGDTLTWLKPLGLALGLFAIACIVSRASAASTAGRGGWHWPLVVFIGMGIVDILFKRMAQLSSVLFTDVLLAAFTLALALALLYIASLYVRGQANWSWRNAVAAVLLGTLNCGNSFFYL